METGESGNYEIVLVDAQLIERVATAMKVAWDAEWNLDPTAATMAGESFKRRLYAEAAIEALIDEEWSSDAEDLNQEREYSHVVEADNGELRTVLAEGVRMLRKTWATSNDFAHYAQMWVLSVEVVLDG